MDLKNICNMFIQYNNGRFQATLEILHYDLAVGIWTHTAKEDRSIVFAFLFFWIVLTLKNNNNETSIYNPTS